MEKERILWVLHIFLIIFVTYAFAADSPRNVLTNNEEEGAYRNFKGKRARATTAAVVPINASTLITTTPSTTSSLTIISSSTTLKLSTSRTPRTTTSRTRRPLISTSQRSSTSSTSSTIQVTSLSSISTTLQETNLTATTLLPPSSSSTTSTSSLTSTSTTVTSSNIPVTDKNETTTSISTKSTTPKTTTTKTTKNPWRPTKPEPIPPPEPTEVPYVPPKSDKPKGNESEEDNKALLIGLAVGVPICAIILCLLLCLAIWCYKRNNNASQKSQKIAPKKSESLLPPPAVVVPPTKVDSNPAIEKSLPPPKATDGAETNAEKRHRSKAPPIPTSSIPPIPKLKQKAKYHQDSDNVSFSSVQAGTPAVDTTQIQSEMDNLGPDKIPAEAFVHKGPLVLKKYGAVDLHHELENEPERKVLSSEHVTWDDKHVVHDMGSEVEIVISNRSKASQKENPLLKTELETDETDAKSSMSKKDNV